MKRIETIRCLGTISCRSGVGPGCSARVLSSPAARSAEKQSRQTPRALTGVVNLLYLRPHLLQMDMRVQCLTRTRRETAGGRERRRGLRLESHESENGARGESRDMDLSPKGEAH